MTTQTMIEVLKVAATLLVGAGGIWMLAAKWLEIRSQSPRVQADTKATIEKAVNDRITHMIAIQKEVEDDLRSEISRLRSDIIDRDKIELERQSRRHDADNQMASLILRLQSEVNNTRNRLQQMEREHAAEVAKRDQRITELEAEVRQLREELEQSRRPAPDPDPAP